ncbi:unnamed protein product [Peronospora effusa]|nr:unnamed protein product [Peronospora effusa]
MATRSKPSVFTALNQLRVTDVSDSDNGSAEERQQERKEKQKLKKKSRSKKKNSDSAQLKNLAFVSVSKPKKNKNKKNKTQSSLPIDETLITNGENKKDILESTCSLKKKMTMPQVQKV